MYMESTSLLYIYTYIYIYMYIYPLLPFLVFVAYRSLPLAEFGTVNRTTSVLPLRTVNRIPYRHLNFVSQPFRAIS